MLLFEILNRNINGNMGRKNAVEMKFAAKGIPPPMFCVHKGNCPEV